MKKMILMLNLLLVLLMTSGCGDLFSKKKGNTDNELPPCIPGIDTGLPCSGDDTPATDETPTARKK
ncbi:MAG: hypothetical protein HQM12_18690 [SAR324 cluster bacterium]|nr:hypothetical protein [SAR324 cluster bacterium]